MKIIQNMYFGNLNNPKSFLVKPAILNERKRILSANINYAFFHPKNNLKKGIKGPTKFPRNDRDDFFILLTY